MDKLKVGLVSSSQLSFPGNKKAVFSSTSAKVGRLAQEWDFDLYVYPRDVIVAEDGYEAVKALEDEKVDFVLLQCTSFSAGFLAPIFARTKNAFLGLWAIPEFAQEGAVPFNSFCSINMDRWNVMDEPSDGEQEYVYIHELAADEDGNTFAAIVNDELGIGVKISFNRKQLPYFMEWKSIASGDYVIGLEPSNSSVYGRKYHEEQNTLHTLAPYGSETVEWSFTILKDAAAIQDTENACKALLSK